MKERATVRHPTPAKQSLRLEECQGGDRATVAKASASLAILQRVVRSPQRGSQSIPLNPERSMLHQPAGPGELRSLLREDVSIFRAPMSFAVVPSLCEIDLIELFETNVELQRRAQGRKESSHLPPRLPHRYRAEIDRDHTVGPSLVAALLVNSHGRSATTLPQLQPMMQPLPLLFRLQLQRFHHHHHHHRQRLREEVEAVRRLRAASTSTERRMSVVACSLKRMREIERDELSMHTT
jgi:hypothetical protein